jgi:biotin operon repressor
VSSELDSHLATDYERVEESTYSTDAWTTAVDTDSEVNRPITWLLSRPAYRAAIQWCLSELNSDDPDLSYHSKAAIAEKTVISRQSLSPNIPDLAEVGIFKTKGNKRVRYAINKDSEILKLLVAADRAVAQAFEE